jgi:hypothetical protein
MFIPKTTGGFMTYLEAVSIKQDLLVNIGEIILKHINYGLYKKPFMEMSSCEE